MLTADLVRTRQKGEELRVVPLTEKVRTRALHLAEQLDQLAQAAVGESRSQWEQACAQVAVQASDHKLFLGLRKLVEDELCFEAESELDPGALRGELFLAAAAERRALSAGQSWDRAGFVEREAQARGLSPDALLKALYADLKAAQVVQKFSARSAEAWVSTYELAQQQAVLLRAVSVRAEVRCRDAYAYRALFRKLKFFRLMYELSARPDGGYAIEIDGPFSLFESSTKYGLQLALALPWLKACDRYSLTAMLRWGRDRQLLVYRLEGTGGGRPGPVEAGLPDPVAQLLEKLQSTQSDWLVEPAGDLLEVKGEGVCVPDLRFIHRATGEVSYLEVLGYWSRDAVFRRVELVRKGLKARVVFAVSSRLRVSEALLDDSAPSELYVYKGSMSPREVLRRLSATGTLG